ncbi:MAG: BatA domain-containing protein [bacterium]
MSFVAIAFLLGTFAVGGPILAHLLARPRYRRIPFTMLRFLSAGQAEIQSRRRLRDFLLLLLRCAIVVLLAIIFAGPQWMSAEDGKTRAPVHYLALDNSLSMTYKESGQLLFDKMVEAALRYIRSAPEDALFHVYPLASQDTGTELNRSGAIAYVSQLSPVPLGADVRSFLANLHEAETARKSASGISACFFSDFTPQVLQQFSSVLSSIPVTHFEYEVVSPEGEIDNCAVAEARVEDSGERRIKTEAVVVNHGDTATTRTIAIRDTQRTLTSGEVELGPHERKTIRKEILIDPPDIVYWPLEFSLLETDGLIADNTYYAGVWIPQRSRTRVLLVGRNQRETFLLKTAIQTLARHNPSEGITVEQIYRAQLADPLVLRSANFLIFTSIPDWLNLLEEFTEPLMSFVEQGGRIAYFVSPGQNPDLLKPFWGTGILPALPSALRSEPARIAANPETPSEGHQLVLDARVVHSLQNYKIDRVLISGFYECEGAADAACLWRFQEGTGFLYFMPYGSGSVLLINTSADDSLGSLLKSPASVAFCRYLLGRKNPIQTFDFVCGEPITLPHSPFERKHSEAETEALLLSPSEKRLSASVTDFGLVVDSPLELGWVKTLAEPVRYAGVNPPREETILTQPDKESLADLMNRVFPQSPKTKYTASLTQDQAFRPIWRELGWILLVLLLAEIFVANRLKR